MLPRIYYSKSRQFGNLFYNLYFKEYSPHTKLTFFDLLLNLRLQSKTTLLIILLSVGYFIISFISAELDNNQSTISRSTSPARTVALISCLINHQILPGVQAIRSGSFNPDSRKRDDEFSPHLAEPPEFY